MGDYYIFCNEVVSNKSKKAYHKLPTLQTARVWKSKCYIAFTKIHYFACLFLPISASFWFACKWNWYKKNGQQKEFEIKYYHYGIVEPSHQLWFKRIKNILYPGYFFCYILWFRYTPSHYKFLVFRFTIFLQDVGQEKLLGTLLTLTDDRRHQL